MTIFTKGQNTESSMDLQGGTMEKVEQRTIEDIIVYFGCKTTKPTLLWAEGDKLWAEAILQVLADWMKMAIKNGSLRDELQRLGYKKVVIDGVNIGKEKIIEYLENAKINCDNTKKMGIWVIDIVKEQIQSAINELEKDEEALCK